MKNIEHDTEVNSKGAGTPVDASDRLGDDLCITSPSNRQNDLETGGEDTAVFSLYVRWDPDKFEEIMDQLKAAQNAARQDGEAFKGDILRIGERDYLVQPAGSKGKGKGSPFYAFVVESRGLRIKISQRMDPHEKIPNVAVNAGSLLLMQAGLSNVWADVQEALQLLGCTIERNKLTRIDAAADLPGLDISVFCTAMWEKRMICRARKRTFHVDGDRRTGIQCGTGDLVLRMYDKALETKQKGDQAKQDFLERYRWGGEQKTATRVEFQLRREGLKSLGVDTVEDWLHKRAAIVAYLCGEWCRLVTDVDKDNGNHTRAVLMEEWEAVREAFAAWTGRADPAERKTTPAPDAEALVKQAAGCLMSAYAVSQPGVAVDVDEFMATIIDRLYHTITGNDPAASRHMERLARRRKVLETQGRAEPSGKPPKIVSYTY